ncbi:carbohydrate kinase family protein [Candidatus Zixiibacteriota bacterium]
MKIALLGTITCDTIFQLQGEVSESYGGLLYSILPLAMLTEPGATIVPVINLGQDVESPIRAILSRHEQISQEGIRVVLERNNRVMLRYTSEGEREEVQQGDLPPLTFQQIEPVLDADAVLVNFISGSDLSRETFQKVRENTSATVYTDIHSLSLGIDPQGRRFQRPLPEWHKWTAQADVVQVNRGEARLLAGSSLESDAQLLSFGRRLLETGPSILLITLGVEGSLMISASGGDIGVDRFPAHRPEQFGDTTGCGDVFLAAFVAEHTRSGDPHRASRFANQVAGAKCGSCGVEDLGVLVDLRRVEDRKS